MNLYEYISTNNRRDNDLSRKLFGDAESQGDLAAARHLLAKYTAMLHEADEAKLPHAEEGDDPVDIRTEMAVQTMERVLLELAVNHAQGFVYAAEKRRDDWLAWKLAQDPKKIDGTTRTI